MRNIAAGLLLQAGVLPKNIFTGPLKNMPPPTRLPAAPAPATAPAPALADAAPGLVLGTWFMPLPPPPAGALLRSPVQLAQLAPPMRSSSAPDPDPCLGGRGRASPAASVEFVPDSQPVGASPCRALVGSGPASSAALSMRIQEGAPLYCDGGGQMASPRPAAGAPSLLAAGPGGTGREMEVAGDWTLVTSRKGPRQPDLPAPAFKPPPIPRWLFGRCCRCLIKGHRASGCRDPLRCSHYL